MKIEEKADKAKDKVKKTNKTLKNWKEELVVWSIVINTVISIIQLIITLTKK